MSILWMQSRLVCRVGSTEVDCAASTPLMKRLMSSESLAGRDMEAYKTGVTNDLNVLDTRQRLRAADVSEAAADSTMYRRSSSGSVTILIKLRMLFVV